MKINIEEIKIESNIPIPTSRYLPGIGVILENMKVGDSIVIPSVKMPSWRTRAVERKMKVAFRRIYSENSRMWRTA